VVVLRHERKAGGDVGDSGRGSSAFGGAVDILLAVRRSGGAPTARLIQSLSRFDETPDTLAIELTPEGYVPLGDSTAVAERDAETTLREILPADPERALPMESIIEMGGAHRTTIQRTLGRLDDLGAARRIGAGKKGDPNRWWAPPSGQPSISQSAPPLELLPPLDLLDPDVFPRTA
jgi:hypothetical protein